MGDEVAPRRPAVSAWWWAECLSRLLERDERSVVWGDLVESGAGPRRALVEISGLVARRQAALWLQWRPWVALTTVAVPFGLLLSYITRWWADASATLIAPYLTRLSWAHLQNPGTRSDLIEFTALLLLGYAALIAWSWTSGFVLGTISPRTRGITGALFCICVLLGTIGTTTTARAWQGNADIFAGTFFATVHPLLLRVVYVVLPFEWGMHASRRRASLPLTGAWLAVAVIVAVTALEARSVEAALSFGAGVIPAPGHDGIVGTGDDARPFRYLPLVLMWPAALIAARALRREHVRIDMAVLLALTVSAPAAAQAQSVASIALSERAPSFDVASVKRNRSADPGAWLRPRPDGGVDVVNNTLRELIEFAYRIRPFQLEGAPDWAAETRYDIAATGPRDTVTAPPDGTPTLVLMLRSLLADRFKLTVHTETRQLPIYALVPARTDGTLGSELRRSTTDCQALMGAARGKEAAAPPAPGGRLQCGLLIGTGRLTAGAVPMAEIVNALGWILGRPVVDRTNLIGHVDATIRFRPEQFAAFTVAPGGTPAVDPDTPSIFTAVQEQLGLRLESTRGPVEVIVVDRVERPAED